MAEPLLVALTVDADNDFSVHPAEGRDLDWSGVERGIPELLEALKPFRAVHTWFVRCDPQIETLYGDYGALLDLWKPLWEERLAAGDELALHPHLYWRRDDGSWGLREDADSLRGALKAAHAAFTKRGHKPSIIRVGESFMNTALLDVIAELGLSADATAMPGKVRHDPPWKIDWEGTPSVPYSPSKADHRRPGEPSWPFRELPMTMIEIQAPYDAAPRSRYLNLAFKPRLARDGIEKAARSAGPIVTVTHPYELIGGKANDGLFDWRAEDYATNLNTLVEAAGREVRFVTLSGLL